MGYQLWGQLGQPSAKRKTNGSHSNAKSWDPKALRHLCRGLENLPLTLLTLLAFLVPLLGQEQTLTS